MLRTLLQRAYLTTSHRRFNRSIQKASIQVSTQIGFEARAHKYASSQNENPISIRNFKKLSQPLHSRYLMTSAHGLARTKAETAHTVTIAADETKELHDANETYFPKAFVNWNARQVACWLESLGALTPDQARAWSDNGSNLAYLSRAELVMFPQIPPSSMDMVYLNLQKITRCNEDNFNAIVEDVVANLKFTKLADLPAPKHKEKLQSFYKKDLAFNPYCPDKFDVRFIEKTGEDPVYQKFAEFAQDPPVERLFPLNGLSGGGKTGTMLNAVGRKQFLIFTECCMASTMDPKDYHDAPFKGFICYLHRVHSMGELVGYSKTSVATLCCSVFWLCHLMLLQKMKTKFAITPEEWIFWTNEGGQKYIEQVQGLFLKALYTELKAKVMDTEDTLQSLVSKYIDLTGAWFAIDEAQIALDNNYERLEDDFGLTKDMGKCSLLHILAIYSLPETSIRIIAGTRLADFEFSLKSGAGKGSKVFFYKQNGLFFPYVIPNDAWHCLEEYFDFTDIKKKHITQAKEVLQGRLRYVFGFIRVLANEIMQHKLQITANEKNEIFLAALQKHQQDLERNFVAHWKRLISAGVSLQHLIHVLLAQHYAPNLRWSVDQINTMYSGVSVEDTGFLFIEKSDRELVYSIKEPFVVKALLSNKEISQETITRQLGCSLEDLKATKGLFCKQPQGHVVEHFVLWTLVNNFPTFLQNLSVNKHGAWLKQAVCKWIAGGSVINNQLMNSIAEDVCRLQPKIEAWLNSSDPSIISLLQQSTFLCTLLKEGQLAKETAQQLLKICNAEKDKQAELLYFLLKPNSYLLQPSAHLGPDIIGFLEYNGEPVLVTFAMSIWNKKSEAKFTKNVRKTDPAQFYHCSKTRKDANSMQIKKPAVYSAIQALPPLPKKVLQINITIPSDHCEAKVLFPGDEAEHYLLHINQDTLHLLGYDLSKVIENFTR